MNLATLSLAYLRRNALSALLNILLLAVGIATITVLLLFNHQMEQRMTRDAQGIDLVVGSKGSPMQLILSTIFHLDTPTGNIPLEDALWVQRHPLVSGVIPLALGDSYGGHRIIGSNHAYVRHYGGTAVEGRLWTADQEATIGADVARRTGLGIGDTFHGVHGISDGSSAAGGDVHDEHPYRVVGVLGRTGTVLDRLILVTVESVWLVHGHDDDHDNHAATTDDGHHAGHDHDLDNHHDDAGYADDRWQQHEGEEDRQLTALLVRYRSPLAAVTLPRVVNSRNALQAASPAFETARLMQLMGIGMNALRAFGWVLVAAAGLGVFIALYNALKDRRYDLALMRSLGASRGTLVLHVLLEGLLLALAGVMLGLAFGHLGAELLGQSLRQAQQLEMTGRLFIAEEIWLILLAVGVGLLAALIPAWQAYRTDIAPTLAAR
ncbi:MAG: FtsX-like permease family protein [Aquisalimonadaceae bacterium]